MPAIVTLLIAAAPLPVVLDDCARKIAAAIRADAAERVPVRCWRMGPLTLGMSPAEVEEALGKPAALLASGDHLDTLYVFPARPGGPLIVGGRARFRQVQLRFDGNRLVMIDNDPGSVGETEPRQCQSTRDSNRRIDAAAIAGPMLRFVGIGIGDPIRLTRARFGVLPERNRPHDWYHYWPVPVSFDVDPDTGRITGITIARDGDTLTGQRATVHRLVHVSPEGCRLTRIDFTLTD